MINSFKIVKKKVIGDGNCSSCPTDLFLTQLQDSQEDTKFTVLVLCKDAFQSAAETNMWLSSEVTGFLGQNS